MIRLRHQLGTLPSVGVTHVVERIDLRFILLILWLHVTPYKESVESPLFRMRVHSLLLRSARLLEAGRYALDFPCYFCMF